MRHQRNNSHASLENALLLHRAGRLEEAESLYRKMPSNPDALHLRGVIAHQLNRNEQAVELIDRAIGARPANAAYHFSLDMAYRALNRLDQVEAAYRRLLERTPDNALIHHRLGNALKDLGRGDEAISTYRKAVLLKPDFAAAYNDMGLVHADRGETDAAVDCYRRALALDPAYAPAHANLGVTLRRRCEPEQAEACYRKAISFDPGFAAAHSNLGNVLQEQGRLEEAINCFQEAVRLEQNNAAFQVNLGNGLLAQDRLEEAQACYATALALAPGLPEAHSQLGCLLARQGKAAEAVACHLQAIALRPNFPEAFNELGAVFRDQGKLQEAVDCGETAVTLKPDFPEAFNNLGLALSHQGKAERAIECFERAVALKPDFAGVYSNLGLVFHNLGRTAEAIACHRKAIDCDPEFATGYTNLLLSAQYSSAFTPEELFAEHARFGARFEAPLKPHWRTHDNSRDAHRRLKIGYVSPDFRRHAVAYFIEPLLACHDKSQVEVFCYYNHTQHDPVTARLQALADHWIPCRHLSDERLAERIRADGIDILIDLAGHTAGNRLLAFARKPAPLQVTYLGYPATTGLSAIDYRITDVHAEPPAMTEQFNVERLWRLPEIFCCYRAHDNSPGVIDHPPALDNGCITFGCFNNFSKVTDAVLELWARILQQVPDARLLLEIQGIDHPPFRAEVEQRMARLGLPLQRLLLEPRRPENQYALYNRIDIALDPFPCNGGTTSLDTVWMGVPFVTLAGRHFTARMGVTILTNAGLPQLIASCEDDYVAIASALARDLPRLRELRAGLRDRVQASPLMDAPRFARHFEQALRSMWRIWCEQTQVQGTNA